MSEPPAGGPAGDESPGTITLHVRRVHLWALGALLIGSLAGFLIGRTTSDDSQTVLYGLPAPAAASSQTPAASSGTQAAGPSAPAEIDVEGHPVRGPEDAPVTMVEFVDFECPFCGEYARQTLPRLERDYGDQIRYVSMQFPLSIHEHAQAAGRAAECAFAQDRYWEYHDELFAHQDELGRTALIDHAEKVGIDRTQFASCLDSPQAREEVDADLEAGQGYGVSSTPTFFVDGVALVGALPYAQFKSTLDDALGAG